MSPTNKRPKPNPFHDEPQPDLELPPGGLHIDGSMLEGGGQILRNAAALAAITHRPIEVDKIRAGRSSPGLRPQHTTGLQLVASLSGGTLRGNTVSSTAVVFEPGPDLLRCCEEGIVADTRTAGSCLLLAQTALPCLLLAAPPRGGAAAGCVSHLELRGGTDAAMAPPMGYMQHVLLPMLRRHLGVDVTASLCRRGFFPKGGGIVRMEVAALPLGTCLPPLVLTERGAVEKVELFAATAGRIGGGVAARMVSGAEQELKARWNAAADGDQLPVISSTIEGDPAQQSIGDGCSIVAVAQTSTGCVLGASCLGERGLAAEEVGRRAAAELMSSVQRGACVDDWFQDQAVIFMALAKGESRVVTGSPTLHTRTAVAVAEALTAARFTLTERSDGTWLMACQGAAVPAGGAAA